MIPAWEHCRTSELKEETFHPYSLNECPDVPFDTLLDIPRGRLCRGSFHKSRLNFDSDDPHKSLTSPIKTGRDSLFKEDIVKVPMIFAFFRCRCTQCLQQ